MNDNKMEYQTPQFMPMTDFLNYNQLMAEEYQL